MSASVNAREAADKSSVRAATANASAVGYARVVDTHRFASALHAKVARNEKIDLAGWFTRFCVRGRVRTLLEMVTLR